MELTPDQAAAAGAFGSVAVTAGAGTGKTHMLTGRYVQHLTVDGFSPLQIVAVTFTVRAADELRARIRQAVAIAAAAGMKLSDNTPAELETSQIGTIHGLAARICRDHPDAAGVSADFSILDEVEGKLWKAEHLDEALDTLPLTLYERLPFSRAREAMIALLADPSAAEKALTLQSDAWRAQACAMQRAALSDLLDTPAWQDASALVLQVSACAGDRIDVGRETACRALAALTLGESPAAALLEISAINLQGGRENNWPPGTLALLKDALKDLRELTRDALKDGLITLQPGPADDALAALLPALREMFGRVRAHLTAAKARAHLLDYSDLEVYALRALNDVRVRDYYTKRWRAILVDEFQDTNPIQAEILGHLSKHALLTIVGDRKQSIFGFRRADDRVFDSFRARITESGGQDLALATSFRTHKELVASLNGLFAPMLGPLHQQLNAHRTTAPCAGPHLHTSWVRAPKGMLKAQRRQVEARQITGFVRQMLDIERPVYDKDLGRLRAVRPGDIAILSRTWEPLEVYGGCLESAGIPTANAKGGNLLASREAKDIFALLRFIADRCDDTSLVAVLRSPFCAVSDTLLFQAAATRRQGMSWWQVIEECQLSGFDFGRAFLNTLLQARDSEPPSRLLRMADRLTGYTAVIANPPGAARRMADWRGMLSLVSELEMGLGHVDGVVHRLRRLFEGEIEIPRPPLIVRNAVVLMTIHAAKGLEWPVVIVPDLSHKLPAKSPSIRFSPELGVAVQRTDADSADLEPVLYTLLGHLANTREKVEARRILYVALTRARDAILLTAAEESGGSLDLLRPGLDAIGAVPLPMPWPTAAGPAVTSLPTQTVAQLVAS